MLKLLRPRTIEVFMTDSSAAGQHSLKILKLCKLVKMLKLLRPRTIDFSGISPIVDDIMRAKLVRLFFRKYMVLVRMLALCHWLACGMKIFDDGWLTEYNDVKGVVWREYLAAIY